MLETDVAGDTEIVSFAIDEFESAEPESLW